MKQSYRHFFLVCLLLAGSCFLGETAAAKASAEQVSPEELQEKIDTDVFEQMLDSGYVSDDDVDVYEEIFEALGQEDFDEVDALLEDLDGDLLKGHVLAEKYLSKGYDSSFNELKNWLNDYADYPQSQRIYKLARRKAAKQKIPAEDLPDPKLLRLDSYNRKLYAGDMAAYENLSPGRKKLVTRNVGWFYKYLRQGKTLKARLVLENKAFRMAVPDKYWDEMSAALAQEYFLDNQDRLALQWCLKPMRRSKNQTAFWIAGLASWRMKKFGNAASYFARLGALKGQDEWLQTAGAYWAYRSYKRLGQKEKARQQLEKAASYPRTFYGILAAYQLGWKFDYNWSGATYWNDFTTEAYAGDLLASSSVRRAVVLFHAGRSDLAGQELAYGYENMTEKQKEAVLFLLNYYGQHSVVIHLARGLHDHEKGVFYDSLIYPVPAFIQEEGVSDIALVLAVSRQESKFNPLARSSAGACGLMQLMPNTAYHVTKDLRIKKNRSRLFDVGYNLEVGQKYLEYLAEKPFIDGNLLYLLAAYNAGPGNLVKWLKDMRFNDDPLLFMEVVPARQTRLYMERVMANYWIYSHQLNLPNGKKTLEETAKGKFPKL